MKILKIVLIALTIIIAIPLLIALGIKKEYAVEREIVINKSSDEVFNYLKYLKNQDNFSVWNKMDPDMKKSYTGTDGTIGFIAHWDSENKEVGKGTQTITNITEGERIDTHLKFLIPFEAEDDAYMITEPVAENQTKVKWGFTGKMDYPSNFFLLIMDMEDMIGGDLETGLSNLKEVMEKQ
ncbi:MAG: SRPBCC family protein [Bacteroidota bacterium]|nr:SRPBCC family protein [Bacteroidota bacterium]